MKVHKIHSTMIDSICYDKRSKLLVVRFKNRNTYYYRGVPKKVFEMMIDADHVKLGLKPTYDKKTISSSVGRIFHGMVKGKFEMRKI